MFNIIFLVKSVGLFGIFAIVFAESGLLFGFFMPGDSLLFSTGLLASAGYLNLGFLIGGSIVAAILGDSVGYYFGHKIGRRIFFKEDSFFFNKKYIDQTKAFYERHGRKTIILARFIPIVRTFAPILAGVGKMEYRIFLKWNIIGGFLWPIVIILAGYFLGNAIPNIDQFILPIALGIIFVSFIPFAFEIVRNKFLKRNKV